MTLKKFQKAMEDIYAKSKKDGRIFKDTSGTMPKSPIRKTEAELEDSLKAMQEKIKSIKKKK